MKGEEGVRDVGGGWEPSGWMGGRNGRAEGREEEKEGRLVMRRHGKKCDGR